MPFLFRLLSLLPLRVLQSLGTALGVLTLISSKRSRRRIEQNVNIAGLRQRVSTRQVLIQSGRTLMELPWLWLRTQQEIVAKVVAVSGWEHVNSALGNGKGIMFLTPHLGCFEITAQYYAAQHPLTVMYRRPKQNWLLPLIKRGRGANFKLATADVKGVRTLVKALRAGEAIGILPDQVPGNGEGVWAPFFGKPAYTMTLAAKLAAGGVTVLLIYAERLPKGTGFHVKVTPIREPLDGELEGNAVAINRALEALIRQCPQQYAWSYNRYKVPLGVAPPVTGDENPCA